MFKIWVKELPKANSSFHGKRGKIDSPTRTPNPKGGQSICQLRLYKGPTFDFSKQEVARLTGVGGLVGRSGGRLPNRREGPPASHAGIPGTAPLSATVHGAFPPIPPTKKKRHGPIRRCERNCEESPPQRADPRYRVVWKGTLEFLTGCCGRQPISPCWLPSFLPPLMMSLLRVVGMVRV